jgi:hypothetical protein
MIHTLDVLESDYIKPIVSTIVSLADKTENQKIDLITHAMRELFEQDRKAHTDVAP